MKLVKIISAITLFSFIFSCKENLPKLAEQKSHEAHRPMYHFTPDSMWMNDPNGMVFYEGEYHLFYQYFPDSTVWGPMHWGHAVSRDMMDWKDLPIALYPDSLGLIFSGSAVIDWKNTSGFGTNGKPPMVAIFTHHNMDGEKAQRLDFQNQSIAYSNDNGRSWTKYNNNPVIKNPGIKDFRDPKVIWHEATQKWILVLAARDKVKFYHSSDLKSWIHLSDFGIENDARLWECPDIFPIKVDGSNEEKWVLITSMQSGAPNGGTGSSYWVGDFDGKNFKCKIAITDQKWLDDGKDNYAFVSWSDVPKSDGRRLGLGWMSNWQYAQKVPSEKWRSAMTLPRQLTLHKVNNDYFIKSKPVNEIKSLEGEIKMLQAKSISKPFNIMDNTSTAKLSLSFKTPDKGTVTIRFSNTKGNYTDVGFDATSKKYFIDRSFSGITDFSADFKGRHFTSKAYNPIELNFEIYLDHSSIELFAEDGICVMTDIYFAEEAYTKAEVITDQNNPIELTKGTVTVLKKMEDSAVITGMN
jgi:fructan beta-fructosidase